MDFYNACTFGMMAPRGFTKEEAWKESMDKMFAVTGCDTVILPVCALQEHAYSVSVRDDFPNVMDEADILAVCQRVHELKKKVIVKAMVNCTDGYWRAYIRFFDTHVPTEPRWEDWFHSYGAFVGRVAEAAEKSHADMLCIGCEMVGTDHREREWRDVISISRERFSGTITYNCDKYQEDHVAWWDALDVISSSGYYPVDDLSGQFARIKKVAEKFNRPFMFMECGCPSREGSEFVPNNWAHAGNLSLQAQDVWYRAFTDEVLQNPFVRGVGWWAWSAHRLYSEAEGAKDDGYCVYGKPSALTVRTFSERVRNDY